MTWNWGRTLEPMLTWSSTVDRKDRNLPSVIQTLPLDPGLAGVKKKYIRKSSSWLRPSGFIWLILQVTKAQFIPLIVALGYSEVSWGGARREQGEWPQQGWLQGWRDWTLTGSGAVVFLRTKWEVSETSQLYSSPLNWCLHILGRKSTHSKAVRNFSHYLLVGTWEIQLIGQESISLEKNKNEMISLICRI